MSVGQPSARDDLVAAQSRGAQKTVVTDLVDAGRRDQDGELLHQLQRLEDHVGGPVAPAALETVKESAVREL